MSDKGLHSWRHFCSLCEEHGDELCETAVRRKLNRFSARYKLAERFESISAGGYSDGALRGYASGLKLFMAYNAAELLGEAIAESVNTWVIEDAELAKQLRQTLQKAQSEESGIFASRMLREKLAKFMDEKTNDVRIPATAIRVMFAHGSFTPTGVDALTKRGVIALQKLTEIIFLECNQRFSNWVNAKAANLSL